MAKERARKGSAKGAVFGWVLILGSAFAALSFVGANQDDIRAASETTPRPEQSYADKCTVRRYGSDAVVYMQTVVKQRLNDPGSARFPRALDGVSVDRATCTFTVRGEFSAKNGFGGRVRGYYTVILQRSEDGRWSMIAADVV